MKFGINPRAAQVLGVAIAVTVSAQLYGRNKLNRADVYLSEVAWVIGARIELKVTCTNRSNYPAKNELCFGESYFASVTNGMVSKEDQENAFFETQKDFEAAKFQIKTLPPHEIESDQREVLISRDNLIALDNLKQTLLLVGIIVWTDDAGSHRREFCRWLPPPGRKQNLRVQNQFPLCEQHNRLVR